MVFLTGGPSTIDMWDMKPAARASIRGEFRPIDTSVPGVQICEHMPRLAQSLKHITLVRSIAHTIAEHTEGQRYVMTGNAPTPAFEHASLGSLAACLINSRGGIPAYATIGDVPASTSGELGAAFNPFELSSVRRTGPDEPAEQIGLPSGFTLEDLNRRLRILDHIDHGLEGGSSEVLTQLDRFQSEAADILRSDKINRALQVEQESEALRKTYGYSSFAMQTLAARRLVEAGARFVTIGFGDWDTHLNNFARLQQTLLPHLDQGLAALIDDLESRGMLDETIVYCTGEFGRTPAVNSGGGRDHWARSMTSLVAGGGLKRGFVLGETDDEGGEPASEPCSPDDLSATIFRQLGFSPLHSVITRSGRPTPLFKRGRPLESLTQ